MKHIPQAHFEEEEADRIWVRRVVSRLHPIKSMFMGVVFKPQPEHNFDGKITMKRVNRTIQCTYQSNRFHNDHGSNQLIFNSNWRNVYNDETYTMLELMMLITAYCELNDDIAEALCLQYVTHFGGDETGEQ